MKTDIQTADAPPGSLHPVVSALSPITFENLRAKGFRLHIPYGNYEPHMRKALFRQQDTMLEIGRSGANSDEWTVWIVSELSHRYGKFCYLRTAWTIGQVDAIYASLTDHELRDDEWSPEEFAKVLEQTKATCREHWEKYYTSKEALRHVLLR